MTNTPTKKERKAVQLIIYLGYGENGRETLETLRHLASLSGLPMSRYIRQKLGLENGSLGHKKNLAI